MKIIPVLAVLSLLLLTACVTQRDATELNEQVDYYKQQALRADSIQIEYNNLQEDKRLTEVELSTLMAEMERLRATNISLNRSYQEILQKYTEQISQNQEVVAVTSYENLGLQEELANKQTLLDSRERELAQLDYELRNKERALSMMEYNYTEAKGDVGVRDRKIRELEAALSAQEQRMQRLRTSIDNALIGFSTDDLTVSERNGKLYLSMSQNLLFTSGSDDIDQRGQRALMKVAEALKSNPDINIIVEGHTDAEGTAARNWDLSVLRATSIVKLLTSFGINPDRLTAAGRGFYAPIANNTTPQGKALNRRTEIILSPKLDNLYEIIQN